MRRAVIVDDERLARRALRSLLGAHDGISIVGEAETVSGAADVVRASEADTVFLDVQLGDESGLDLLPRLDENVSVIFVTAFDRYAVRAFEVNAIDYLLKPVSASRLAEAVERLQIDDPPGHGTPAPLSYDDFLFVRAAGRMRFLKVRTMVSIAAHGSATQVRLASGEIAEVRKSIGEWESRLPPTQFVRIHRSVLINLDYVERVEDWFHATYRVHMRGGGPPLQISRRYASQLRSRLG
jgi:two-component system, LytTR family, response regulator